MSYIRSPFEPPYSTVLVKQRAKKYYRKFMQEFAEATLAPAH
jgi:hypothetical protein